MGESEVILEIGAEGGSITLCGTRTADGWRFSRNLLDQTPELLDEPAIEHDSNMVESWSAALELLDTYPWHRLFPLWVHPEFRGLVLDAVKARYTANGPRGPDRTDRWEELCLPADE